MKANYNKILIYMVLFAFIFATQAVFAEGPMCGEGKEGRGPKDMVSRLVKDLDLTQEQQTKLEAQRELNGEQREKIYGQMKELRTALKSELEKPQTNMAAVNKISASMKELSNEATDMRIQHFLQLKEVLTPDQFQKFVKLHDQKRERRRERKMGAGSRWGQDN